MEPLRQEYMSGRKAEDNYQDEIKRRQMAKAKKEDIPEEKHFPIRYLPTDTTLKQKLERCMDAKNMFGSEQRQVACYNFESELSSENQLREELVELFAGLRQEIVRLRADGLGKPLYDDQKRTRSGILQLRRYGYTRCPAEENHASATASTVCPHV